MDNNQIIQMDMEKMPDVEESSLDKIIAAQKAVPREEAMFHTLGGLARDAWVEFKRLEKNGASEKEQLAFLKASLEDLRNAPIQLIHGKREIGW